MLKFAHRSAFATVAKHSEWKVVLKYGNGCRDGAIGPSEPEDFPSQLSHPNCQRRNHAVAQTQTGEAYSITPSISSGVK